MAQRVHALDGLDNFRLAAAGWQWQYEENTIG